MRTIISTTSRNTDIALNEFNIVTNFHKDAKLCIFNEDIDLDHFNLIKSLGIKYYGGTRLSKLHQYFLLSRFGIYTPKTYYNIHTNNTISTIDELNAFVDLDEFVVKPPNGARGIGVKKITRQFCTTIEDLSGDDFTLLVVT